MNAEPVNIKVQLDAGAYMPVKAHEWENGVPGDAGYDVKVLSVETEKVEPCYGGHIGWVRVKIETGVHMQPPPGYRIMAVPNSRITKTGFTLPNSPGTIDANYRGSIKFIYLYPYAFIARSGDEPEQVLSPQVTAGMVPMDRSHYLVRGFSDYNSSEKYAREFWKPGTVCGQLIVVPDYDSRLEVVDSLTETSRGDGGFGSTQNGKEGGDEEK